MKSRLTTGAFLKIPLGNNENAYGRSIDENLLSFYKIDEDKEYRDNRKLIEAIEKAIPIFSIHTHKSVFSNSNWEIIGQLPLGPEILNNMPVFFRQDIGNKNHCVLVNQVPGYEKPVTPEECIKMERSAVWDEAEQIEERLRDHFAGRPNRIVEFFKVKL